MSDLAKITDRPFGGNTIVIPARLPPSLLGRSRRRAAQTRAMNDTLACERGPGPAEWAETALRSATFEIGILSRG